MAIANTNRFTQPAGFQYWEPGQGSALPGFDNSPVHEWMAENDPQGYYGYWLGKQGYLGNDMNSDFARSLQSKFQQGYKAEQFANPDADWRSYLDRKTGQVKDIAMSIDPRSRGVSRNQFVGGSRWLPRSN